MSQNQSYKDIALKAKELIDIKLEDHKKRLIHSYGVAKMAQYLAERYGIDPYMAKAAGYMHDYSKYDDFNELKYLLNEDERIECEKYPFLYHAYLSAYYFKELISDNIDIYNAIKYHVFGRLNMSKLEEIIMISDFTEENREYEACIRARKILIEDNNLYLAIIESLKSTISHCQAEGKKPHPMQLEIIKEYEKKMEIKDE